MRLATTEGFWQALVSCVSLQILTLLAMGPKSSAEKARRFLSSCATWFEELKNRGRGCRHCSHQCLIQFADTLHDLQAWREQWADLNSQVQDAHLSWMFFLKAQHGTSSSASICPQCDRVNTESEDTSDTPPRKKRCQRASSATSWSSSAEPSAEYVPTSSGTASESGLDIDSDTSFVVPNKPNRKQYHGGQPRRPALSLEMLGLHVCLSTARDLVGVGKDRLRRLQDGAPDGRRGRKFRPGLKQASVWRFLWKLYHSVAEGMPDKFSFEKDDAQTAVVRASKPMGKRGPRLRAAAMLALDHIDPDVRASTEDEARAIAGHAMYLESLRHPQDAALVGPGMFRGPLRFLPPGKRVHLYWEYTAWTRHWNMLVASFPTFLRAFGQCDKQLRIRKVGLHAVCDTCTCLKKRLKEARWPKDRQAILEEYTSHVLMVWLDRQVYANATTTSLECRRLLDMGERFSAVALSISQLCMAVDGMDQAKFRVPRILLKTKSLDKLYRPALHIQGAWAHGWGYNLAVMDADMKHDANDNIDVVIRLLDQIFRTHGGLPKGLHLQQDNTCRECKNQKVLKWAIKLVALGVFRWVSLNYLITGHTHEDLDATFGQLTVKLSMAEFDDDMDVVEQLMRLSGGLGIDAESRRASIAYKLDEAPEWEHWWDEVGLQLNNLTGPSAPHVLRVCLRRDLGCTAENAAERGVAVQPLPGLIPHGDDVVLVVKAFMSSPQIHQMLVALPFHGRPRLSLQPAGLHGRRLGDDRVKGIVARRAEEVFAEGHINSRARDYLVQWASGVRRRLPKPEAYAFLSHRWHQGQSDSSLAQASRRGASPTNMARILAVGQGGAVGEPLPAHAESDDDPDQGPLILAA